MLIIINSFFCVAHIRFAAGRRRPFSRDEIYYKLCEFRCVAVGMHAHTFIQFTRLAAERYRCRAIAHLSARLTKKKKKTSY